MKTCFLTTAFLFCSSVSFAQLIDVKPPLDYLSLAVWIFPAALGIVAALIVFVLIRRWRRLSGKKTKEILPPWQKASRDLAALEKEGLIAKGYVDQYYSHLSDILRRYIEERFSIRAPEMTTEEFYQHLRRSSDLHPEQKESLKRFLESCDMVKFAKYVPDPSESKGSFDLAGAFVEETTPKSEDSDGV